MTDVTVESLVRNGSLAQALVDAQRNMPAVAKDSDNPHFNSRFTSLDSLIAATRPPLNEAGLSITQFPTLNEHGQPVLTTTITHGPSGEQLSGDTPLYLSRQDMQGFGAAITYARRYAWASLLGIASEEDTDGNVPGPPPPQKRMATKPQKAKMGVLVKHLAESGLSLPPDYPGAEDWVDVLKQRLAQFGVTSRADLTVEQASELIDWLEEQAIPF